MTTSTFRAIAASGITTLVVSSSLLIWLARADDGQFPDGPGKAIFVKVCTPCHALDIIAGLRHSKEEWKALVYNMKAMGADATDKECDVIIDYLAKHFPRNEDEKKNEKKLANRRQVGEHTPNLTESPPSDSIYGRSTLRSNLPERKLRTAFQTSGHSGRPDARGR